MNLKRKGYCCGVVICTIAIVALQPGLGEPVGVLLRPEQRGELGHKVLQRAARLKEKPQHLGQRLRTSNVHPQFKLSTEHWGEKSGVFSNNQDLYLNNPPNTFKPSCNNGEVKLVVPGRFDFGAGHVSPHDPSGWSHSGAEVRAALQPVVECAEASMTLTVRRRWAAQLRVSPGNVFSFTLSRLPPHCGYSVQETWRDISLSVQYNSCHVVQEGDRYVLPLLWRRTPVKISCPVSIMKSQTVTRPSLCCSQSGVSVTIQSPSTAKELNVNVRGEWTPLLELVQHCGYSVERRNTEILITAPFLSCGIILRDGNRALSLQIGDEVFLLTCHTSLPEVPQHLSPQPPTAAKPMTPKPFQWGPPFYLAPPHYHRPTYYHRTHIHGNVQSARTTATAETQQRGAVQHEQSDHTGLIEEYYRKQAALRGSSKAFPHVKHTSSRTQYPTPATASKPTLMSHNYVFNPYYHYYHHPKIPLTNPPPEQGPVVKTQQPGEGQDKARMFYLHLAELFSKLRNPNAPAPHDSFQHDLTKTGIWKPMDSSQGSPLPTLASHIHRAHTMQTKGRVKVWPDHMPPPTLQHPSYGTAMTPNTHLLPDLYQLFHFYQGSQGKTLPSPLPLPQQTANPVPPSENPQDGFGWYFQPELPVQFGPGNYPAEGWNNEAGSKAHSDPSYDGSSWEKWFNMVKGSSIPEQQHVFPPLFPVKEDHTNVQDPSSASSVAQPWASPCSPGTGSHFHLPVSPGCLTFPVKECTVGEYFVFSLPEFVVGSKVVSPGHSESCALKRLTSNPHLYFVPLEGCGVTKQVIDALNIYQLELETCDSDNSLKRLLVECSSYPGFPAAETLSILDPLPLPSSVPLQLRIATDESHSYHPEAHLPLSSVRGRPVLLELSVLQSPDPSVLLRTHSCLAYTVTPASVLLLYDSRAPGSEWQLLPSPSQSTQYIVVTSFLSLTSPSTSSVNDVDPEVYFFCLTEVCSGADGQCSPGCINSFGQK